MYSSGSSDPESFSTPSSFPGSSNASGMLPSVMPSLLQGDAQEKMSGALSCPICLEVAQLPVNVTCFPNCKGTQATGNTCLKSVMCQLCANQTFQLNKIPNLRFSKTKGMVNCLICRETEADARLLNPATTYRLNQNIMELMDIMGLESQCRSCQLPFSSQSELQSHYQRKCPFALVQCKYQGCNFFCLPPEMEQHKEVCPVGRSKCPQCSIFHDKSELLLHMVSSCKNRMVSCVVCKQRARLPEMLEHLQSHQSQLQKRKPNGTIGSSDTTDVSSKTDVKGATVVTSATPSVSVVPAADVTGAQQGLAGAQQGQAGPPQDPGRAHQGQAGALQGPSGAQQDPGRAHQGQAGPPQDPGRAHQGPSGAPQGPSGAQQGLAGAHQGQAGGQQGQARAQQGQAGAHQGPAGGQQGQARAQQGLAGAHQSPAGAHQGQTRGSGFAPVAVAGGGAAASRGATIAAAAASRGVTIASAGTNVAAARAAAAAAAAPRSSVSHPLNGAPSHDSKARSMSAYTGVYFNPHQLRQMAAAAAAVTSNQSPTSPTPVRTPLPTSYAPFPAALSSAPFRVTPLSAPFCVTPSSAPSAAAGQGKELRQATQGNIIMSSALYSTPYTAAGGALPGMKRPASSTHMPSALYSTPYTAAGGALPGMKHPASSTVMSALAGTHSTNGHHDLTNCAVGQCVGSCSSEGAPTSLNMSPGQTQAATRALSVRSGSSHMSPAVGVPKPVAAPGVGIPPPGETPAVSGPNPPGVGTTPSGKTPTVFGPNPPGAGGYNPSTSSLTVPAPLVNGTDVSVPYNIRAGSSSGLSESPSPNTASPILDGCPTPSAESIAPSPAPMLVQPMNECATTKSGNAAGSVTEPSPTGPQSVGPSPAQVTAQLLSASPAHDAAQPHSNDSVPDSAQPHSSSLAQGSVPPAATRSSQQSQKDLCFSYQHSTRMASALAMSLSHSNSSSRRTSLSREASTSSVPPRDASTPSCQPSGLRETSILSHTDRVASERSDSIPSQAALAHHSRDVSETSCLSTSSSSVAQLSGVPATYNPTSLPAEPVSQPPQATSPLDPPTSVQMPATDNLTSLTAEPVSQPPQATSPMDPSTNAQMPPTCTVTPEPVSSEAEDAGSVDAGTRYQEYIAALECGILPCLEALLSAMDQDLSVLVNNTSRGGGGDSTEAACSAEACKEGEQNASLRRSLSLDTGILLDMIREASAIADGLLGVSLDEGQLSQALVAQPGSTEPAKVN